MRTAMTIDALTRIILRVNDTAGLHPLSQSELDEYIQAFATRPPPEGKLHRQLWDLTRRMVVERRK